MKKQNKMFGAMLEEEEPTDYYLNDNRSKGTARESLNGGAGAAGQLGAT